MEQTHTGANGFNYIYIFASQSYLKSVSIICYALAKQIKPIILE